MEDNNGRLVDLLAEEANKIEQETLTDEGATESTATVEVEEIAPVTVPQLPIEEVRALYAIEKEGMRFQQEDLPKAKQELELAKNRVIAVQGGIDAANIMISRRLDSYGVTPETYIKQRDELLNPTSNSR